MFLFFLLFLPKLLSLYIFETYPQPVSIRELPQIFIRSNQTQTLNLNDYFQGFNLTFMFNDLKDPFLSYSYQSALSQTTTQIFQGGFYKVFFLQSIQTSATSSRIGVILATPTLIYSVSLDQIQKDFNFPVHDFLNIPNNITCGNIFLLNQSLVKKS